VGGVPVDRKHVPKARPSAQPSMCVNVSLRSSSAPVGVGWSVHQILVCQRPGDRQRAAGVRLFVRSAGSGSHENRPDSRGLELWNGFLAIGITFRQARFSFALGSK
jgi:hypothetical protein